MRLRYRYRLDPDPAQRRALAKAFGCARVVFNDGLRAREDAYKAGRPYLSDGELSRRLTVAKGTPERAWLGEVSAVDREPRSANPPGADRRARRNCAVFSIPVAASRERF